MEEINAKDKDPNLKKLSKPATRLSAANRCRPADSVCLEAWKKKEKDKPKSIGQRQPQHVKDNGFANLLAANSRGDTFDPLAALRNVSDTPFGLDAPHCTSNAVATRMLWQGGGIYGDLWAELAQRRNTMGRGGEDLFSGNYSWGVPIVSLPGRAGHDLNLSLSYNSHIWIKTGNGLMKMLDYSEAVSPIGFGFNLGLPYLRAYDHTSRTTGGLARLVILPSGQAIELIKRSGTASTGYYESIDGSLLRLAIDATGKFLFFPNGTRLKYSNSYQCEEIRDRNGNRILTTYDATYGYLTKLTDTLGREVTFEYGPYFDLSDIKQTRKDENGNPVTVTLAHFGYSDITINTNFSVACEVTNGTILPMLTSAILADGSLYKFTYTSYGQVKKIQHYAPLVANPNPNNLSTDYRELSSREYNLPESTGIAQSDCPRFSNRHDWAFEWNGGVDYGFSYATDNSWGQITTPDQTKHREYFSLGSWQDGLPIKTESYDSTQTPGSSTPKRTTLTTWENHATWGARVANSTVTDGENGSNRYTLLQYTSSYNLVFSQV